MRYFLFIPLLIISVFVNAQSMISFDEFFVDGSLRIDYIHAGTATTQSAIVKAIIKEPYWGGNKSNLIDKFNFGAYRVNVYDINSNKLIYNYGFCSLFEEWQTTDEAKTKTRSFQETIIIPYPKSKVKIELIHRNRKLEPEIILTEIVDPEDINIEYRDLRETVNHTMWKESGDYNKKVDLVVIAEGYNNTETEKFRKDADNLLDFLFNEEPFNINKDKFNVYLIEAVSEESGTDTPGDNIWKKTALNSRFYTFGSERYLTSADYHIIRDYASVVPCDQIMILVNSDKYGGGGIYNFYSISSAGNMFSNQVLSHEFGHAFAALGDEYYTSSTAYNDFYDLNTEPYQPNITTLVNFDSKWKDMVDDNTPIPTPDTKEYANVVGVYEGAGYSANGIYRPMRSCRMKELNSGFCPVCLKAIESMINYYAK
ncbi:MAG TPA: M64 family metallopeptidase [Bacteroidales bacterium]|nr:M64 family metallopeptidase [Bacteroidales bacterium]